MANKESSVFSLASEAGGGRHWLLLKSLLSVLAVSLSSGAPLQHIKRSPKTKLLCGFFHGRKDRLLMRLQSLTLSSSFVTLVSDFSSHCKKRDFISLLFFYCDSGEAEKGISKALFGWFMVPLNILKE